MSGQPSTPTRSEAGAARALARSLAYRALAAAFRHPAEGADHLGSSAEAAHRAASALPARIAEAVAGLAAAARGVTAAQLAEVQAATFSHVALPDFPLYETACGPTDAFRQPQTLADLHGFYRAFGLDVATGAGERVDHLAVELEFMHFLAFREAWALERHGPEQVTLLREAQCGFLERHLGTWAPTVARALTDRAAGPLDAAGRLLDRLLAWDLDEHGAAPVISAPVAVAPGTPMPAADRGAGEAWEDDE